MHCYQYLIIVHALDCVHILCIYAYYDLAPTEYTEKVVGSNSPGTISMQGTGTTSVEILGLRPLTSYNFNVSGMTKAGTGPAGNISSKTPERGEMLIFCTRTLLKQRWLHI